jgi:hypothetical protein
VDGVSDRDYDGIKIVLTSLIIQVTILIFMDLFSGITLPAEW